MTRSGIALGIDSSTQSTTAVAVDLETFEIAAEAKVHYRDDPRLAAFGLTEGAPILAPREAGEADQPAALYLAALEAALRDLPRGILGRVRAIDVSAQQHGQVWLGSGAAGAFAALGREGSGAEGSPGLAERFSAAYASDRAPIWMSSNTAREAAELRGAAGGAEAMIRLSGSDSPLRFSGAALRRKASVDREAYSASSRIHLISSFLSSALAGREDAPVDWGNGAGTSLMDWKERRWSPLLVTAASKDLPGGEPGLRARLPELAHPLSIAGRVAAYFVERYGIPQTAVVVAGSGDNPQTKVLATGALLSLGTSFVIMAEGDEPRRGANAMYDGLGRPFLFGCRTNGALVWESIRREHGLDAGDFAAAERALAEVAPGSVMRVLQLEVESFPESPPVDLGRREDFASDYAGAVDSALGLLWLGSSSFASGAHAGSAPRVEMAVAGGAAASEGVRRRVAAIWERPVALIGQAGAAAGAAVAAAAALVPEAERGEYAARAAAAVSSRGRSLEPDRRAARAYHGAGGYLARLAREFESGFGGPGKPRRG